MRSRERQKGVVAVIVAIALVGVIAVAGLALDVSRVFTNKARVQTVVDAAALAAAKVLDTAGTAAQATSAAQSIINTNRAAYPELAAQGDLNWSIEFSNTLIPFSPGTSPPLFARVTLTGFETRTTLSRLLGVDEIPLRASAVAGPSASLGTACDVVPIVACGDAAAGAPYYGYEPGRIHVLKYGAQGATGLGPGNYHLLRIGGSGGNVVRQNLAGGYRGCLSVGETVTTEPGNEVGPTVQGINTRFNKYQGGGMNASDYPPDVLYTASNQTNLTYDASKDRILQNGSPITHASQASFNHSIYQSKIASGNLDAQPRPVGNAVYNRRELAVPIGNCAAASGGGTTTIPLLGFGCFFLLQEAIQQGSAGNTRGVIMGEFITSCNAGGRPGPAPVNNAGPHILQLYRDQRSPDS